jgi:hypothetical protein
MAYESMYGFYFYGDFCSARIWAAKHDGVAWQTSQLMDVSLGLSSFGEDEAGNLYLTDRGGGRVYLIAGFDEFQYLPIAVKN